MPVPRSWVEFVEEIQGGELGNSTRVGYLQPNGTQLLTVERLTGFYQDYTIEDYLLLLESQQPDITVDIEYKGEIKGLQTNGVEPREPALELHYRSTTSAKAVVPDDPAAQDQNRSTFAHLLPYAGRPLGGVADGAHRAGGLRGPVFRGDRQGLPAHGLIVGAGTYPRAVTETQDLAADAAADTRQGDRRRHP